MSELIRQRVQARLRQLGLSANAASEAAGLDRSVLRKFLNGTNEALQEVSIRKLSPVLGVAPNFLRDPDLPETGPSAEVSVPVAAGPRDVPVTGELEAGAWRPLNWFNYADLGVIENGLDPHFPPELQIGYRVRDQIMDKAGIAAQDGLVAVDPWQAGLEISDGDLVIVEQQGAEGLTRELTVRRLGIAEDRLVLEPCSSDPRFQALTLPLGVDLRHGAVRIVGLVTSVIRRLPVRRPASLRQPDPPKRKRIPMPVPMTGPVAEA